MYTSTFKIVIFGDAGCGKTTLTHRFLKNLFVQNLEATIGIDFQLKAVNVDGEKVKLQIWDFAGEERYRFLLPSYIKGINGGIFMYDVTNYASLAHVDDWLSIVNKEVEYEFPLIFIGGKNDLAHLKEVPTVKAMEMAEQKGAKGFFECSSKTGENVLKIFDLLAILVLKSKPI